MEKTLKEYLADIYLEYYNELWKGSQELKKNVDNMIVWPVSLSAGAILLMNSTSQHVSLTPNLYTSTALILVTFSILAGVFARFFYTLAVRLYFDMERFFQFRCMMERLPTKPFTLAGKETSEQIYYMLQESFKIDYKRILDERDKVDPKFWHKADENARKFYKDFAEFRESEFKIAVQHFDEIIIESFGYREDYFEKRREKGINHKIKKTKATICKNLGMVLYISSIILFSGGTILLLYYSLRN